MRAGDHSGTCDTDPMIIQDCALTVTLICRSGSDSGDSEEDAERERKPIPEWAREQALNDNRLCTPSNLPGAML